MTKKIFSKINIVRFSLAICSIAILLLVLPHAGHKGFTYELNQPWRYALLTADFDIPIFRDSTSMRIMRDSIDRTFVPFVKRDKELTESNLEKFAGVISGYSNTSQVNLLSKLMKSVYDAGIIDNNLSRLLENNQENTLRLVTGTNDDTRRVEALDASLMYTEKEAYFYIDSIYKQHENLLLPPLTQEQTRAIGLFLSPNITLDSLTDTKFRDQEYLTVTGATGVIKTGQRIVDRGEIITPQIYTNLNTYQEMMSTRQSDGHSQTYFIIGQGLYIAVILMTLYIFLGIYRPEFFSSIRKMTFLVSFITLFTLFAILMFENIAQGLYIVPFAAVPVIVLVFFDSRTAIFALLTTVFLSALVATFQLQFIFMEVVAGLVATFSIWQLDRRSQLLRTAALTLLSYWFTYLVMCLISEGNLSIFSWRIIAFIGINAVILSFAYILMLVIEKLFGFTSAVTLVELSDINSPLLRRLAEEAPGTFQHSIQVSTIAAEAARAIGANTTLVRTGALYHDIGKLENPVMFTENQHGVNPHTSLDPVTSAKKIVSHVTAGAALASKHKLPPLVKSFILEHHGKGMAKYFYTTAVNNNPDKVIEKEDFSYPGPNPQSKETAILMMADAVEAASRSLKDYSPESIDKLVNNIINGQVADGMFKESPISFKDIETIKQVFKKRLSTIYHTRVSYPEMNKSTATAEMLNKVSSFLLILILGVSGVFAQTNQENKRKITVEKPNLEEIKEKTLDPSSPYYFPKLMTKYNRNDTVMTNDEYRYFYLGYMFQEDYDPYRTSPYAGVTDDLRMKPKHSREEIDTIKKYAELTLRDNPFDLRQMSFLIHILKENRKDMSAKIWEYRLEHLLGAIKSTGTGENIENAWFVIYPVHEYDMVRLMGYEATDADFIEPGYDYLTVRPDEETQRRLRDKVAQGFYFNVIVPQSQYEMKHPEIWRE